MPVHHFAHPRLGFRCACDECLMAEPVLKAIGGFHQMNPHLNPNLSEDDLRTIWPITLKFLDKTPTIMHAMRHFTGARDDGTVIQAALRTYEWVLYRQAQGLMVRAGKYYLVPLIPNELRSEAVEFFEQTSLNNLND